MTDPVSRHNDRTDTPATGTSERTTPDMTQPPNQTRTRKRRTPDVLTLVVGLMSLAAATMVLAGWIPQLRMFDLRWVLSGGAVVLGVLLLAASARSPRNRA